jgi:glycosyltransferase involved in cell wall biosynthesis
LWLTLQSIIRQSSLPDEIIIADDGSNSETQNTINTFKKQFSLDLIHVWHEDTGFRLSSIRNKAIAAAKSQYIIQIDGDLILHKNFIEDHIRFAKPKNFVSGTRCMINESLTKSLIQNQQIIIPSLFDKALTKKYNGIRFSPLAFLMYYTSLNPNNYKYVLGCNMAFWKKDLIEVNGYNEAFEGWGKEDNDISIRLINLGLKLRFIKFNAIVYHLHHRASSTQSLSENEYLMQDSIHKRITFIEQGISNYTSS